MACSDERSLRLPEEDHLVHSRGERQPRRDRLYGELFHPPAESPECSVDPLSGRESRITVSISGALCSTRNSLFERVTLYWILEEHLALSWRRLNYMRPDIVAAAGFPDYELTDHPRKPPKLHDLQRPDP